MPNKCNDCEEKFICGKGDCKHKCCTKCVVEHYINCSGEAAQWNENTLPEELDDDLRGHPYYLYDLETAELIE